MSAIYALGLLGIVVVLFLLLTIVFRAEKRAVWPFGELEAAPAFSYVPDSLASPVPLTSLVARIENTP